VWGVPWAPLALWRVRPSTCFRLGAYGVMIRVLVTMVAPPYFGTSFAPDTPEPRRLRPPGVIRFGTATGPRVNWRPEDGVGVNNSVIDHLPDY
jgi:hypothetical protein